MSLPIAPEVAINASSSNAVRNRAKVEAVTEINQAKAVADRMINVASANNASAIPVKNINRGRGVAVRVVNPSSQRRNRPAALPACAVFGGD